MKKTLVYSLAVAMLLVSLTACQKPQTDQQDTSQPDPATTSSSVDVSTPEPPAEPEPEPPANPAPEQLSNTTVAAPVENEDPQDQAEPAAQEPAEPEPAEPEPSQDQPVVVDPFTEVNETVYATGGVNLRSGPGTGYEKVGSLKWGDSVTRIGVGTGEAKGWSRIVVGEKTVCVSNSYISTTKPEPKPAATTTTPSETEGTASTGPIGQRIASGGNINTTQPGQFDEVIETPSTQVPTTQAPAQQPSSGAVPPESGVVCPGNPEGRILPPGSRIPDPSSKWFGKAYITPEGDIHSFRKAIPIYLE